MPMLHVLFLIDGKAIELALNKQAVQQRPLPTLPPPDILNDHKRAWWRW